MPAILGSGEHRYRVVDNFAKLPEGWQLTDVASVAVDSKDRVYVFNRGAHPMVVLDREGNFLRSFGEGLFSRAHGLHSTPTTISIAPMTATTPCANAPPTARCC
ncbi:hypothetical protein AB7M16_003123 [Bradyrhizobium sp. USDA 372]